MGLSKSRQVSAGDSTGAKAIARLGLTGDEMASLRRQGFVSQEMRGRNLVVYKLRFRIQGRIRVRYLGTDEALAGAVRDEMQRMHQPRRHRREMQELVQEAQRLLQACRPRLEAQLKSAGYAFHGRAVRRKRGGAVGVADGEPGGHGAGDVAATGDVAGGLLSLFSCGAQD